MEPANARVAIPAPNTVFLNSVFIKDAFLNERLVFFIMNYLFFPRE